MTRILVEGGARGNARALTAVKGLLPSRKVASDACLLGKCDGKTLPENLDTAKIGGRAPDRARATRAASAETTAELGRSNLFPLLRS